MKKVETSNLASSIAEITASTDQAMVKNAVCKLASRYEVKSVAYFGTGIAKNSVVKPYLVVTYSSEWIEQYKRCRYVKIDPVIKMGMRRLLPLDWDEFDKKEGILKTFFGEASEFGLGQRGLTIPVHGRGGDRALFTVTSDNPGGIWRRQRLEYMRDFQLLAVHLHNKVLELEGCDMPRAKLSPRELECLQWTAEGKTAWECSVILGISEHTVRCYLESARHKLNASSNTHAVSIAYRSGVLFPLL